MAIPVDSFSQWRCRLAKDFGKGSGNSAFQAGLAVSSMLKKNLRRGERVFLNLRLLVFASVERGDDFLGEGKSIDVSDQRSRAETGGGIRNLSSGNEVVLVSGLAREGVNFFSSNCYSEGASIETAIPYTSKAPNVFSLVRIVAARREKYRAAYLVSGDFADEVPQKLLVIRTSASIPSIGGEPPGLWHLAPRYRKAES